MSVRDQTGPGVRFLGLVLFAVVLCAPAVGGGRGGESQAAAPVLYTAAQAKRGEGVYGEFCSACHGQALTGGDEAAALTGARFTSNWSGRSAGDLFTRIRTTMPPGEPNKLTRQQTADVLAFVLHYNNVPEGPTELPLQGEVLKQLELSFPQSRP